MVVGLFRRGGGRGFGFEWKAVGQSKPIARVKRPDKARVRLLVPPACLFQLLILR